MHVLPYNKSSIDKIFCQIFTCYLEPATTDMMMRATVWARWPATHLFLLASSGTLARSAYKPLTAPSGWEDSSFTTKVMAHLMPYCKLHVKFIWHGSSSLPQVADALLNDVDLRLLMHTAYGKGFMKACRLSPDAYTQMALQLAYYRVGWAGQGYQEKLGEYVIICSRELTNILRLTWCLDCWLLGVICYMCHH